MRVRYGGKEYSMPPPGGYNFPRFITEEAQNKFDQIIQHRDIDGELWFPIEDDKPFYDLPRELASTINKHNWKAFLNLSDNTINPVAPIVQEFYSCILDRTQKYVSVRGELVYFTPKHINFHYGIIKDLECDDDDDDSVDEYQDLKNTATEENLSSIMKAITVEGTDWKKEEGKKNWKVSWEALKPVPKIWYQIICSRLLYSLDFESFDRDRLLLLHCILEGRSINVGKIIYEEIIDCAFKKKKEDRLLFPSLISGLCTRTGVIAEENETRLINQGVMDLDSVIRFYKEEADKRERLEEEKFVGGDEAFVRRAIFKHMQQDRKFWGFYNETFFYQRRMFELNFEKRVLNPPKFPEDILEPFMRDDPMDGQENGKDVATAEKEHDSFVDDDGEDSEKRDARNKRCYEDLSADHEGNKEEEMVGIKQVLSDRNDCKKRSKTSSG